VLHGRRIELTPSLSMQSRHEADTSVLVEISKS